MLLIKEQPLERMPSTSSSVGTRQGSVKPGTNSAPYLDEIGPLDVEAPTGRRLRTASVHANGIPVPTAPHESDPGHTYRLAQSLDKPDESPDSGRAALPDGTYVPVPDRVLDTLDELSGCEVRLCLLLIRSAYGWDEDIEAFRASPRWQTARQVEEEAGGLGMSRESLRRAAEALETRGWVARRTQSGGATAYRWRLKVPKKRYTPVPAPLLHVHQALSHSALVLLLSVMRATLGWAAQEGEEVTYRRTATLSASELGKMTGRSRPTLRDAQDELRAKSALYMRREHAGAPYEFAVDFSFFRLHLQKSYTPTNREKNSNNNTHARETTPDSASTKGGSKGQAGRSENAYRITEEWERDAVRILSSDLIGMDFPAARDLVIRRSRSVVEGAIQAFRRRDGIRHPAGWMHQALKNLWFGPSIADKSPDVRESGGDRPIAKAFQALTEKREGWEWNADAEPSGQAGAGLDAEPTTGVSHGEMAELIDALRQPPGDWETVERRRQDPLFVPSKALANWAYRRRDAGSDRFREAARRIVILRARHEGRPSPLESEE